MKSGKLSLLSNPGRDRSAPCRTENVLKFLLRIFSIFVAAWEGLPRIRSNLMKITSVRPALNGRFSAILKNGEEILISRKYVPALKRVLKGGES